MDENLTPKPKRRGMRLIFGISLALNLVFVGVFAGAAIRHVKGGDAPRAGGQPMQNFGSPLARSLPREARRDLLRGMRKDVPGMPSRRERHALFQQIDEALRAVPFDPEAVAEIFAAHSNLAQKMQTYGQEKWLALVSEMTDAERIAVAARLQDALNRPQRKKKRDQE